MQFAVPEWAQEFAVLRFADFKKKFVCPPKTFFTLQALKTFEMDMVPYGLTGSDLDPGQNADH
jgi:hypothetical protein